MNENTVTEWAVLNEAHAALRHVVSGLTAADLGRTRIPSRRRALSLNPPMSSSSAR